MTKLKRTRWYKKWVWVKLDSEEAPTHCLCLGMMLVADSWFFCFRYENGDEESVAVTSVARIRVSKADLQLAEASVVSLPISAKEGGHGNDTGSG